jgi:hypothetical protein
MENNSLRALFVSTGKERDQSCIYNVNTAQADQLAIQKLSDASRRRGVKESVLREAIGEAKLQRAG